MKNLEKFNENKIELSKAMGGADDNNTHTTHHTPTENRLTGACDTRIKEYPDYKGKGLVGTGEMCTQEVECG